MTHVTFNDILGLTKEPRLGKYAEDNSPSDKNGYGLTEREFGKAVGKRTGKQIGFYRGLIVGGLITAAGFTLPLLFKDNKAEILDKPSASVGVKAEPAKMAQNRAFILRPE